MKKYLPVIYFVSLFLPEANAQVADSTTLLFKLDTVRKTLGSPLGLLFWYKEIILFTV